MTSAFTMDIFYSILTLFYLFYRGDRVQQFSLLQIKGMENKGQTMLTDDMFRIRDENLGFFNAVRKLQLSLNWSLNWSIWG